LTREILTALQLYVFTIALDGLDKEKTLRTKNDL